MYLLVITYVNSTTCLEYDGEFIKKYKVLSNAKEFIVGKSN